MAGLKRVEDLAKSVSLKIEPKIIRLVSVLHDPFVRDETSIFLRFAARVSGLGLLVAAIYIAFPGSVDLLAGTWRLMLEWKEVLTFAALGLILLRIGRRNSRQVARRRMRPMRIRLHWHVLALLIGGVVVAAATSFLLWTLFGEPNLRGEVATTPTAKASEPSSAPGPSQMSNQNVQSWAVQNTFEGIKIVLAVVGGIGAVVALSVAYRKQRISELAEHREDMRVYNERFVRAAELIGSDEVAIRVSGIYSMAALAEDWDDGRQTCINVLCANLRMPKPSTPETKVWDRFIASIGRSMQSSLVESRAVQAANQEVDLTIVRIIADHLRPSSGSENSWMGYEFDFTGATLRDFDFSGIRFDDGHFMFDSAEFVGRCSFAYSRFEGARVSFMNATFRDEVLFTDARFDGVTISFSDSTVLGKLDFDETLFRSTVTFAGLQVVGQLLFRGSQFAGGVIFDGSRFEEGAFVSFASTVFYPMASVWFDRVAFNGGEVKFSFCDFQRGCDIRMNNPSAWRRPPTFKPVRVPSAVTLPSQASNDLIVPSSDSSRVARDG